MRGVLTEDGCGEFLMHTRYSELLILKEQIEREIKTELAKDIHVTYRSKDLDNCRVPEVSREEVL